MEPLEDPGAPRGVKKPKSQKSALDFDHFKVHFTPFWHHFGTISGVRRIALRCVAVRREVLCCDHLGSPSRRVAVCCGASCRVVSRKTRNARKAFSLPDLY